MSVIDLKGDRRAGNPSLEAGLDDLRPLRSPDEVREGERAAGEPDLGDLLAADRERDENAGFLESSVSFPVDQRAERDRLAFENEAPAHSKKRRRKGSPLDPRLQTLEGVLSEAELETVEDLIESAAKNAGGGFLGSKEIFENLMEKITEALRGSMPLELYIRSEISRARQELESAAGRRIHQLARLLRDLFGEDAGLVMAYMRHGLNDKIRALLVHYESALVSSGGQAPTEESIGRQAPPVRWGHAPRLVRLYERALSNGRFPGRVSMPLDEASRAAVIADLLHWRGEWKKGEEIQGGPSGGGSHERRRSDALVRDQLESLRARIAEERERHENAGFLESARRGPARQIADSRRRQASWPARATQIFVGPFRHRGPRSSSHPTEDSWLGNGERAALASLIESFKRAQGHGQLAHHALANMAEAILEAVKAQCPLELLVSGDNDRIQSIFAEIAMRRMAYYRRLLRRRYKKRGEEVFELLESIVVERLGSDPDGDRN